MYKISLSSETMKALWINREFCGGGSIVQQVRNAVREKIQNTEKDLGCTFQEAQEVRERYAQEKANR